MPPNTKVTKPPAKTSSSRDLVPVGPRHVSAARVGKHGKRDENGEKPTTTRALILRNGKHGARGTGELMVVSKLSGREKLDLLAEDLVDRSKKAVGRPFRIEECLKIAESQCDAFVDDIANLRESLLFKDIIEGELNARTRVDPKKTDPRRNPSYVAQTVGTRIHNAYMLASAWKIVRDTLHNLEINGLSDGNVKLKLKNDTSMRDRYLMLCEMVNVLVSMSQTRFSVLATTSPHYSSYFKQVEGSDPNEPEYVFDWGNGLRPATLSFLDSIILELCFPREIYPKAVLYQLLRDAVEESPKDAKRFPQALWDAIGDLSVSVELQQTLEAPLFGNKEALASLPQTMPEEYDNWLDAQSYSEKASSVIGNFKDLIFPLDKTKNAAVLENMWKSINSNYQSISGQGIDSLWHLEEDIEFIPQWSSIYTSKAKDSDDSDYDSDGPPALSSAKGKHNGKRLAITSGASDSDGSMPELQSVSNSSDEDDSDDDTDSEHESDEESDDSGYDTEQEDEIRDMLREAMDTAHEADWFDSTNAPVEIDPFLQEDRKGNPFLKLLGSLRGRMFTSSPKLKTAPRNTKPGLRPAARMAGVKPKPPLGMPGAEPPKSHKVTLEEVEDEDDVERAPKKKKKKKPKKKKKLITSLNGDEVADGQTAAPPPAATPVPSAPAPTATKPVTPTKKATPPLESSKLPSSSSTTTLPHMSTTSLNIPIQPTTAQSARSYLQTEQLDKDKTKTKTRADHASLFSDQEKPKKGFLSKLGIGKSEGKNKDTGAKHSWFSKLGKKTTGYMHQLLNTVESDAKGLVPMKWENFLKLMREMGFEFDPSTAGSSVRFDPPDKRDKSITFHKPHPDPTLQPNILRRYAARLKRHYGWTEEDFLKHAAA